MNSLLLKFLSFFILIHEISTITCPNGSEQFPNEDVCLYTIAILLLAACLAQPYQNAVLQCNNLKGNVARVQNIFENAYLLQKISQDLNNAPAFIGVIKQLNGTWTYADGSTLTYQNWAPAEPINSTTLNCTLIDPSSGRWKAATCSDPRPFFCTVVSQALGCPNGWQYFQTTDFCYYLQNFTYYDDHWIVYNFTTAEENCQKMNSNLVSIHSKEEDDFVYGLIEKLKVYGSLGLTLTFTVANLSIEAPQNASCLYQAAWIGLYGTAEIGNGNWTDGSLVDYVGCRQENGCLVDDRQWYWQMYNDISCQLHLWAGSSIGVSTARYVCKTSPKSVNNQQS